LWVRLQPPRTGKAFDFKIRVEKHIHDPFDFKIRVEKHIHDQMLCPYKINSTQLSSKIGFHPSDKPIAHALNPA